MQAVEASPNGVLVFLPHQLRERTRGQRSLSIAAGSVREVIEELERTYPGMRFSLCYETGELRQFVNVFVGEENVRYLDGLETELHSGDVIHIIHSVAGGQ